MRRIERLVSALIVGGVLLAGGSGMALAQSSTEGVDASPNPEQCNQAPRTIEEIEGLLASASPGGAVDTSAPEGFTLPVGEEASSEVRGEIVATIVQIIACANGGDPLSSLGGWTDALLATQIAAGMFGEDALAALAETPVVVPEELQTQLLDTRDFTLYDDGRAGVLIYFRTPTAQTGVEDSVQISLWIFAQEDGRWLLDETVTGLEAQFGDVATPPAG